ncbi:MAG: carboxypeptidase M32, partial [Spirochaetales bacterium]
RRNDMGDGSNVTAGGSRSGARPGGEDSAAAGHASAERAKTGISRLRELDSETQLLSSIGALLSWDQETYMPEGGIADRSKQLSLLSSIVHERETSDEIGELLNTLGADEEHPDGGDNVPESERPYIRQLYRDYRQATKLPAQLVRRMAEAASTGQSVWAKAREADDFSMFRDHLASNIDLNKEKAECLGYSDHPYDALLDTFEPWMTTAEVTRVFDRLQASLVPLVEQIADARQVDDSFLHREVPIDRQEAFGREVLADMGWDFTYGRLDVSAHPFTTDISPNDVRLTTRYQASFLNSGIFGTMHEAGHGLYERGSDPSLHGTRLAGGTSLGIHESQSRTWENVVGRSRPFWSHYLPRLKEHAGGTLDDIDLETFYRGINKVEPSLIRVEADEVTYSLHIILRFRLEKALIEGAMSVDDLPEAWRELSGELIGVRPETDSDGVLQDIHWSMGAMGYFPTYALGNLYGACFWNALCRDIPDVYERMARGQLIPILDWLRSRIHSHGKGKTASELVHDVTGEALSAKPFVDYLTTKYREVYSL